MTSNIFIDTQEALDDFCKKIRTCKEFGIDTEFVRRSTYFPIPCILQIAADDNIAAIDLTKSLNFDKLIKIFSKKSAILILHAFRQDLEVLKQVFGKVDFNFFDTQIAGMFLGEDMPPSYGRLVLNYFDIRLQKELQYSNWQKRPLTDPQIEYALLDVKYLFDIYKKQLAELKLQKKYKFFVEETNTQVSNFGDGTPRSDLSKFYAYINSSKKLYIAKFLCDNRLKKAMASNKSKTHVLSDKQIIDYLFSFGKDNELIDETISQIEEIYETKYDADIYEENYKQIKEHSFAAQNIDIDTVKKLQALLAQTATETKMSQQLIASKSDLVKLLINKESKITKGWRHKVFGKLAASELDSNS